MHGGMNKWFFHITRTENKYYIALGKPDTSATHVTRYVYDEKGTLWDKFMAFNDKICDGAFSRFYFGKNGILHIHYNYFSVADSFAWINKYYYIRYDENE
jgi:hypothetical protein